MNLCPFCSDAFSQKNLPHKILKCKHLICAKCLCKFQKKPQNCQIKCKTCKFPEKLNYSEKNWEKSFPIDFKICKKLKLEIDDYFLCKTHNRKCTHFCVFTNCNLKVGCLRCTRTMHRQCLPAVFLSLGAKKLSFQIQKREFNFAKVKQLFSLNLHLKVSEIVSEFEKCFDEKVDLFQKSILENINTENEGSVLEIDKYGYFEDFTNLENSFAVKEELDFESWVMRFYISMLSFLEGEVKFRVQKVLMNEHLSKIELSRKMKNDLKRLIPRKLISKKEVTLGNSGKCFRIKNS